MNVRAMTAEGIERAHLFLDSVKGGTSIEVPSDLLTHTNFSEDTGVLLQGKPDSFENRFTLALWLNQLLDGTALGTDLKTVGTWTWLTLYLFDVVAPRRADGTRRIGERSLYVLEADNWRRYYRHLLAGPYRVMRAHWSEPRITEGILAGKPNVPGELYEQIASRQEIVTSRAVVNLTRRLYWDSTTRSLKRGAGGAAAGSPRRLAGLLLQLDLTWDLGEIDDDSLFSLLPRSEYSRFT